MKIRGRQIANGWLLVLGGAILLVSPFLLMGFFLANDLAGAILGPPAIWNRAWHAPAGGDLAGSYHESERHWKGGSPSIRASLQLNSDGTMTMNNFPNSDGELNCVMSGSGSWKMDDSQVDLILEKYDNSSTCKIEGLPYGIMGALAVAGHSKPYTLYRTLGDPDSGEGVWLRRD